MEEILPSIGNILECICELIKPGLPRVNFEIEVVLKENLQHVTILGVINVKELHTLQQICCHLPSSTNTSWEFVCVCLHTLLLMKKSLDRVSPDDETGRLLSVSQEKAVRSCFEFIVSLGLLPNLLPGVGLPLEKRCSNITSIPVERLDAYQKYCRLCSVTRALLALYEDETLQGLLMPHHLGDLISSLAQLSWVPLKEPPEMPASIWQSILADRVYFTQSLESILKGTYQPLLIRELMVLQGNKVCPRWLKRQLCRVLSERLVGRGGVAATVRAVLDVAGDPTCPRQWSRVETVARLVTSPHSLTLEQHLSLISDQILELVQSNDKDMVHVGVVCLRVLYEMDELSAREHFHGPLFAPLLQGGSEQEVSQCITDLHNCFTLTAGLPPQQLLPLAQTILCIHCKVHQSMSHISVKVADLLATLLKACPSDKCETMFCDMIFGDVSAKLGEFPIGLVSGLKITNSENENTHIETSGDCLIDFLETMDSDGVLRVSLFTMLLHVLSDSNVESELENRLVCVKLLARLAEDSKVHLAITKDPKHVVNFIKSLLEKATDTMNSDIEIVCLALMVLGIIVNNAIIYKLNNWSIYKALVTPLCNIKEQNLNEEVRTLAQEAYLTIVTRGVSEKDTDVESCKELSAPIETGHRTRLQEVCSCEEALHDACDSLLPVRGHAIMQLTKLIAARDPQVLAKKETVLCLLQENLKHTDSFLYLNAVNGLAALANELPDTVLVTLTEQYACSSTPEMRLKVGEVLLRVVRQLGDLVPVYKAELLNCFLSGTRDKDHLIRASSLSNLGEVCCLLAFRIGPIASEIFECLQNILKTDKAPEPRRAAVMVISLLFKGLKSQSLQVLEPILLELYRILRRVYKCDSDDVVRLHAQLALEELNQSTVAFLCPDPNYSKKIVVLDTSP